MVICHVKKEKMWLSVDELEELKNRVKGQYIGSDYRFNSYPIEKETRSR